MNLHTMSASPFKYLPFALTLLSTIVQGNSGEYVAATPSVQPLYPRGLRLSLPHEKGISVVEYNIKINEAFNGLQSGHISRDIVDTINGQWTYEDRSTILKKGDVIYFWMRVTHNDIDYNLLQEKFVVDEFYNYDGSPARTNLPGFNPRPGLDASILNRPASNSPTSERLIYQPNSNGGKTVSRRSVSNLASSVSHRPILTAPPSESSPVLSASLSKKLAILPSESSSVPSASLSKKLVVPSLVSPLDLGSSVLTRRRKAIGVGTLLDLNPSRVINRKSSAVVDLNLNVSVPSVIRPFSKPDVPDSEECRPTQTKVYDSDLRPVDVCAGQLIFEDTFNFLNKNKWKLLENFPGAPAYEFVMYMNSDENVYVRNGILNIQPILTNDKYGPGFVQSGSLVLERCTLKPGTSDCQRTAIGSYILPPIISGRLDTSPSFRFTYGRIEVRAKLPQGDWLYPKINLQAVRGTATNSTYFHTFLIAHSNGNPELRKVNRHDISGHILVAGRLTVHRHQYQVFANEEELPSEYSDRLWSNDFHVYAIEWRRDKIIATVDGKQFGEQKIEGSDVPVYINLGVAAGGRLPFPDNCTSGNYVKPWKSLGSKALFNFYSAQDQWIESWKQGDTKLQVDYVKVWAL